MSTIILSIVLALVGYFVLMYLATNIIGMVVRGFFKNAELEDMKNNTEVHDFLKKEIRKNDRADIAVTITSIIFCILFLYLVYRYLNVWILAVALVFMAGRIPDLLWEIRNGQKMTKTNMPHKPIYVITGLLDWVMLPVFWWGMFTLLS